MIEGCLEIIAANRLQRLDNTMSADTYTVPPSQSPLCPSKINNLLGKVYSHGKCDGKELINYCWVVPSRKWKKQHWQMSIELTLADKRR